MIPVSIYREYYRKKLFDRQTILDFAIYGYITQADAESILADAPVA